MLLYRITNISDTLVAYVQINDPGILENSAHHASLFPGDSTEIAYRFVMASPEMTSQPTLTYLMVSEEYPVTEALAPSFFTADSDLTLSLTTQVIVNPGDTILLEYTLVNCTGSAYNDIRIEDAVLGHIGAGLSLEAGETYTGYKVVTINEPTSFRFVATAVDEAGHDVTTTSNDVSVITTDSVQ